MPEFISSNPALDAFHEGTRRREQQLDAELARESRAIGNITAAATAPYDIQNARNASRLNQIRADEAEATSPYAVQSAESRSRLAATQAETAEEEAANRGFFKSLELYKAGRFAEGDAVLQRYGEQPLPDALKQDTATLFQIEQFGQEAKRIYPNRPADQQRFIQQKIMELGQKNYRGEPNYTDPAYVHRADPNLPQPPEQDFGKSGGRLTKFEIVRQAALNLGYDPDSAFRIATGERQVSEIELHKLAVRIVSEEYEGRFGVSEEQKRRRIEEEFAELKRQYRIGAPPAPQPGISTPPAAGAQGTSTGVGGSGTEADPYRATTQSDLDWIRQNAPAGAVVVLPDGRKIRKD